MRSCAITTCRRGTPSTGTGAGLRPAAFIDWDLAAPGQRIRGIAHMCWQYAGLGLQIEDAAQAARQVRLICDLPAGRPRRGGRHELVVAGSLLARH
jgi:hypothetical protein